MKIDDFEQVHSLWMEIHGFGIRSIDDSKEGVERFIRRNPTTSMVAVCDGKIVGAILCGHDGRRAGLYHVCVQENYRKHRANLDNIASLTSVARTFDKSPSAKCGYNLYK